MGHTVTLGLSGASFTIRQGFHRQLTMPQATNITMELFRYACELLHTFWAGYPVRRLNVSLSNLTSDREIQLSLFEQNRERLIRLGYAMDDIKNRYGTASLLRASSLLPSGQAVERAKKIGGHYK